MLGALETAGREEVVELDGAAPGPRIHSCRRSATSRRPLEARAVHRALAGVGSDVEERARHLAVVVDGPDAAVASVLQTVAGQAAARGPRLPPRNSSSWPPG